MYIFFPRLMNLKFDQTLANVELLSITKNCPTSHVEGGS